VSEASKDGVKPPGADVQEGAAMLVPGRSCGTCGLCCKVYTVKELSKPEGQWCPHVERGHGCKIHAIRPQVCRQFYCSWLVDPNLGPEWKPEVARFVISADPKYQALTVSVDPGTPLAWKREPYYATLKQFSKVFFPLNKKVLVSLRGQITIVLPDCDVPLGLIIPGEEIVLWREGSTHRAALRRDLERAKAPSAPVRPATM
jgi:hypothetical protein